MTADQGASPARIASWRRLWAILLRPPDEPQQQVDSEMPSPSPHHGSSDGTETRRGEPVT